MMETSEVSALEPPSVALSANQSLQSFQHCLAAATIHPRELSMVEDQLARFSTWAASIGIFAPGRGSMDHRLRYTKDLQNVVIGLLDSLSYRIQACTKALETAASNPSAPTSYTQLQQQSFLGIATEISYLNKISNTIRRASKDTQSLRAANFQIRDDEGNDIEPTLLEHFEHYIRDAFPGCSEIIQTRLAKAMLARRKRILYRRYRQGNTIIRLQEQEVAHELVDKPDRTTIAQSQVMTATTLNSKKFKMAALNPSVVSSTKTVALINHQALVFPSAPGYVLKKKHDRIKNQHMIEFQHSIDSGLDRTHAEESLNASLLVAFQEIGEIACPYCLYALPAQDVFNERKWQQHVKNDLDPYVCLFEDCNQPEVIYSHSEEWLIHLHEHTKAWRCFSHPTLTIFKTRDEYLHHIRHAHGSSMSNSQLRILANKNCRNAKKLFHSCPLCGADATDIDGLLEDHITGHLRSLALKSLPAYEEEIPDDFDSAEESIPTSQPQSRSTINMSDGESLWPNEDPSQVPPPLPPPPPPFMQAIEQDSLINPSQVPHPLEPPLHPPFMQAIGQNSLADPSSIPPSTDSYANVHPWPMYNAFDDINFGYFPKYDWDLGGAQSIDDGTLDFNPVVSLNNNRERPSPASGENAHSLSTQRPHADGSPLDPSQMGRVVLNDHPAPGLPNQQMVKTDAAYQLLESSGINPSNLTALQLQNFVASPHYAQVKSIETYFERLQQPNQAGNKQLPKQDSP